MQAQKRKEASRYYLQIIISLQLLVSLGCIISVGKNRLGGISSLGGDAGNLFGNILNH